MTSLRRTNIYVPSIYSLSSEQTGVKNTLQQSQSQYALITSRYKQEIHREYAFHSED